MIRIPKICAKFLILLLLFSGMAAMAGISWLKSSPRTLPGMDSTLNRIIAQQGWPFSVSFASARTHWEEWDSPLSLAFQKLEVKSKSGEYHLQVPGAVVTFRLMPLLKGRLKFREITLLEPVIHWQPGTLPPAPKEPQTPEGFEKSLASHMKIAQRNPAYLAALNAAFDVLEKPQTMPFRHIRAMRPVIHVITPEEERNLTLEELVFQFYQGPDGPELKLNATKRQQDIAIYADILLLRDTGDTIWAKSTFENAGTSWLDTLNPKLSWYTRLGLSYTGEVNALVARSGQVQNASFGVYSTPHSSLPFTLSGSYKNQPLFREYSNIPDVEMRLEVETLPVQKIAAYWPYDLGKNARSWVTQNLLSGQIDKAFLELKLPPEFWITGKLPVDGLRAEMPYREMDLRFSPELPRLDKITGTVEFTRDTMRVTVQEGTMLRSAIASGATAFIPNLGGAEVETMEIQAATTGPITDLLHFYSVQQKKLGKKNTLDASKIRGEATSRFTVQFPLLQALLLKDIAYTVRSEIKDFGYKDAAPGISLSNGLFSLEQKEKAMQVRGSALLNGVQSAITYNTSQKEGHAADMEITVRSTLPTEKLSALGFPSITELGGTVGFDYQLQQKADRLYSTIFLDGTDTAIAYPIIGFAKAPGTKLDVQLELEGTENIVPSLKRFAVAGQNITAKGTGDFAPNGALREVYFETLAFGSNDGQLKIARDNSGRYLLQAAAKSLNLEPLIRYYKTQPPSTAPEKEDGIAFTLKGTAKQAQMAGGEVYSNVAGELTCNRAMCTQASLSAKIGDGQNLTLSLMPGDTESVFSVQAENAGAVLRGLDILSDIRGGVLTTRAVAQAGVKDAPFTGNLIIKDFRVVGAPILAKLLTLGSLTGIVNTLNGKGISFTKLDGRYSYGNSAYQLNDFKLYGSSIGILVNGYANLKDSLLKLSGTLIPAYGLNKAIGQVPIVGNLLGKGVFATSFSVEGPIADPKTEVYPLSALAPGILSDFMRDLGILPAEQVKQPATPDAKPAEQKKGGGG